MDLKEYGGYDAIGLAELVAAGEVTPRELAACAVSATEAVNPELGAVVEVYADRAEALGDDLPNGPFRGVPFLLKDLGSAYAGVPLTSGSRFLSQWVPGYDAELVRRHKAAGLLIVGKTNTPELGAAPVCEPALFGPTHTPWKLEERVTSANRPISVGIEWLGRTES